MGWHDRRQAVLLMSARLPVSYVQPVYLLLNRMMKQRRIELLAPAKNLECGIEAINHGADAVYIGAPRFGARAAAGNSLEDIATLVAHAHLYNARIYVTVNTILKEEELKETEALIWDLYRAGVDALIVQDMGITRLHLPPIPLHASTQMDNRTPERVRFLAEAGFQKVGGSPFSAGGAGARAFFGGDTGDTQGMSGSAVGGLRAWRALRQL